MGFSLQCMAGMKILLNSLLSIGHEGQPEQAGANCWRGGCLCPSQVVTNCFILFYIEILYLRLCLKGSNC
jgi:hypothetical protein